MVLQQRYSHLGDVADLRPLSFQIIRFKMMARHRKIGRRGENISVPVDGAGLSDPAQNPEMQAERAERRRRLIAALESLGDRCRTLFRLKLEGRSFEEIRLRLGAASINTVYTWDLRCRQELKMRMGLGAPAKEQA